MNIILSIEEVDYEFIKGVKEYLQREMESFIRCACRYEDTSAEHILRTKYIQYLFKTLEN